MVQGATYWEGGYMNRIWDPKTKVPWHCIKAIIAPSKAYILQPFTGNGDSSINHVLETLSYFISKQELLTRKYATQILSQNIVIRRWFKVAMLLSNSNCSGLSGTSFRALPESPEKSRVCWTDNLRPTRQLFITLFMVEFFNAFRQFLTLSAIDIHR